MHKIMIPKKKKGEFRLIYKPSKKEKKVLRNLFPSILEKALNICDLDVCQGFFPNTNPVTNASRHIGYKYTTMMDLKDFFDSINTSHLLGKLSEYELSLVLVDGAPRQGLPTSPIVANIAASDLDNLITSWIKNKNFDIVYTRYADDLAFSYNEYLRKEDIFYAITTFIEVSGFNINHKKTRTLSAKNGRRIITGIAVDEDLHPPRRMKRKMRAALHQRKMNKYNGIGEWCKMKKPNFIARIEMETMKQKFTEFLDEWGKSAYNSNFLSIE